MRSDGWSHPQNKNINFITINKINNNKPKRKHNNYNKLHLPETLKVNSI